METGGRDNVFGSMLNKVIEDLNKPEQVIEDKKVSEGKIPDENKDTEDKKIKKLTEQDGKDIEELEAAIHGIVRPLEDAISLAEEAKSVAKDFGGECSRVVAGQLDAYLIPHLHDWIENEDQPGSVASLLNFIESGEVEEPTESKKVNEGRFDKMSIGTLEELVNWMETLDLEDYPYGNLEKDLKSAKEELERREKASEGTAPQENQDTEDNEIDILNDDIQSTLDDEYDGVKALDEARKKMVSKKGKPLKKGAKVRSRGDCVFPYTSPKVTDNKDHFPINKEKQAVNALGRASQYKSAPPWYKGSLESLVKKVQSAVHSKYPDIKITKASAKPGKG